MTAKKMTMMDKIRNAVSSRTQLTATEVAAKIKHESPRRVYDRLWLLVQNGELEWFDTTDENGRKRTVFAKPSKQKAS